MCDDKQDVTENISRQTASAAAIDEIHDDAEYMQHFWHTTSHILAQAVKRLYPETKLAIGPSIKNGFYYDMEREPKFTEEDLRAIEKEMKKIVKENYRLERFELPRAEAIKYWEDRNEPYKVELIHDMPEDTTIVAAVIWIARAESRRSN